MYYYYYDDDDDGRNHKNFQFLTPGRKLLSAFGWSQISKTVDFKCDVLSCPEKKRLKLCINCWSGKRQPYIENAIAFSDEEIARIENLLLRLDRTRNCDCRHQIFLFLADMYVYLCRYPLQSSERGGSSYVLVIGEICGKPT